MATKLFFELSGIGAAMSFSRVDLAQLCLVWYISFLCLSLSCAHAMVHTTSQSIFFSHRHAIKIRVVQYRVGLASTFQSL